MAHACKVLLLDQPLIHILALILLQKHTNYIDIALRRIGAHHAVLHVLKITYVTEITNFPVQNAHTIQLHQQEALQKINAFAIRVLNGEVHHVLRVQKASTRIQLGTLYACLASVDSGKRIWVQLRVMLVQQANFQLSWEVQPSQIALIVMLESTQMVVSQSAQTAWHTARRLQQAQQSLSALATRDTRKSAPIRSPAKQHLAPRARLGLVAAALCVLLASTRP
jgi:hypothetical protein